MQKGESDWYAANVSFGEISRLCLLSPYQRSLLSSKIKWVMTPKTGELELKALCCLGEAVSYRQRWTSCCTEESAVFFPRPFLVWCDPRDAIQALSLIWRSHSQLQTCLEIMCWAEAKRLIHWILKAVSATSCSETDMFSHTGIPIRGDGVAH